MQATELAINSYYTLIAATIVLLLALQFIVALGIGTQRERRAQASLSLPDRLPAQELP